MNRFQPVLTAAVALTAAVFGLAGCADSADPQAVTEPLAPTATISAPAAANAVPTEKFQHSRASSFALAELQAHVEAALYLHREGAPGAVASGHLTRGLSQHKAAQQRQFDLLGLDRTLVVELTQAMSQADATTDLEPQIEALQAHFQKLIDAAQGNPLNQIRYLIDRVAVLYTASVEGEAVVAPDTYYEALGYATIAFHRSSDIKGEAGDALRGELNDLLNLWPGVTASTGPPATTDDLRDQLNRVRDVLRYTR